jgi:proton-translocating NADH-quinone oxidoreductase chain M
MFCIYWIYSLSSSIFIYNYINIILFFIYIIFIIIFVFLFFIEKKNIYLIKYVSLYFSWFLLFLIFLLSFFCFLKNTFILDNNLFLYTVQIKWISFFNITYNIGLDSISLIFLWLVFILIPISILITYNTITYKYKEFIFLLFLIEFLLFNLFITIDLFFFFLYFESILIPMFLIIGIWGSRQRKIHASYQFFFYTMFGSIFMLFSIILIYSFIQTTDIRILYNINFSYNRQIFLWLCFFIVFAIKVPLFPFHIWLPEAHVEAPTVGSVLLAGILLKLGTYGMLRFLIFLFTDANYFFSPLVYTLCIFGIIYTSFTTIRQIDLKKIIAYSSVGHMSYVILGLFSNTIYGIIGSLILMIGHGLISSGLFFLIGIIYDRYKTRLLRYYGGLAQLMPIYSFFLLFLSFANLSFPGTINFIAEVLILLGAANTNIYITLLATFAIILTAIYSIWLLNRLIYGSINLKYFYNFSDLSKKEFFICFFFCFLILIYGLFPNLLIYLIEYDLIRYINFK